MSVQLNEKALGTLVSTTVISDTKTAASHLLFTVPTGKTLRITGFVARDATGTLTGGTSYAITNWRAAFSLAALITANTGYIYGFGADLAQYTESAAGTLIYLVITTGSTTAYAVTLDLFGVLTDA